MDITQLVVLSVRCTQCPGKLKKEDDSWIKKYDKFYIDLNEEYEFLIGFLILIISSIWLYFQIKEYLKIEQNDQNKKYFNVKITGSLFFFFCYGVYLILNYKFRSY